jgi:hypothetical protein
MGTEEFWVNKTITIEDNYLEFDLAELSNRWESNAFSGREGVPMWFSDNSTVTTTPQVVVWIYRQDPHTTEDILAQIQNLLYADMFYLKMEYDRDFIREYENRLHRTENLYNNIKKYMIILGAGMVVAGLLMGEPSMIFWGSDMVVSTYTGKSILDHIAHTVLGVAGFDQNFIGNFSIWQMTSNTGLNLILQEAFAGGLSSLIRSGTSRIANRFARSAVSSVDDALESVVARTAAAESAEESGRLSRIINSLNEKASALGNSRFAPAGKMILKGMREYTSLASEVIFEMAFDNAFRLDEDERPMGGGGALMIVMTLSVLTTAALGRVGGGSVDSLSTTRSWSRTGLRGAALALSISQLAMQIPVFAANLA